MTIGPWCMFVCFFFICLSDIFKAWLFHPQQHVIDFLRLDSCKYTRPERRNGRGGGTPPTTTTTTKKHLRGCLVTHSFISSMYQPEYQCWCAGAQIQLEQLAVLLKRAQKLELAQPGWCRDEVFFCLFGGGFRAIMAFCMNNVPLCHLCPPPTPK